MNAPHLVSFLQQLEQNNNKQWFDANRGTYEELRQEFLTLITDVLKEVGSFEPGLTRLDPKRSLFRINRDVRFSPVKLPYNTHFSSSLSLGPKDTAHAGYYLRIDAENDLVIGAGLHGLSPTDLERVRRYIANHYTDLDKLLAETTSKGFSELRGEALKTIPRGYPADHPAANYLKYKGFYVSHIEKVDQAPTELASHIASTMETLKGLVGFWQEALGHENL
jgi:uncharacterized protein (TIGR02453 family)